MRCEKFELTRGISTGSAFKEGKKTEGVERGCPTFVVGVEVDARHEERGSELFCRHSLDGSRSGPGRRDLASLQDEGDGDAHKRCKHGNHGKRVGSVHVLALIGRRHGHLGEDGACGEEEVGHHGGAEAGDREGELPSRGDGDAGAHGQQRGVNGKRHDRPSENGREDGSKDGLSCLDDVDEADSPQPHRHDLAKARREQKQARHKTIITAHAR